MSDEMIERVASAIREKIGTRHHGLPKGGWDGLMKLAAAAAIEAMEHAPNWQPIETAPKEEPIFVFGYNIQGQAAPGGPYKYWFRTVGQITHWECEDLLRPGMGIVRDGKMETPTHWMPLPEPPLSITSALPADTKNLEKKG